MFGDGSFGFRKTFRLLTKRRNVILELGILIGILIFNVILNSMPVVFKDSAGNFNHGLFLFLSNRQYLHSLLHRYIQRVLICPDKWEVDPDKLTPSSLSSGTLLSPDGAGTSPKGTAIIHDYCARKQRPGFDGGGNQATLSHLALLNGGRVAQPGSLVFSQTQLLQHLDLVWEAVRASLLEFPR